MSKEPDLSAPAERAASGRRRGCRFGRGSSRTQPVGRPKKEKAEPVIQFSTRLGLSFRETIDAVEDETGHSIRSIIEQAIQSTYPDHYKKHGRSTR